MERATGIEPVFSAWEGNLTTLYFQHLQNRSAKIYMHALHIVHALPDFAYRCGTFAGRFCSVCVERDRATIDETYWHPASAYVARLATSEKERGLNRDLNKGNLAARQNRLLSRCRSQKSNQ